MADHLEWEVTEAASLAARALLGHSISLCNWTVSNTQLEKPEH